MSAYQDELEYAAEQWDHFSDVSADVHKKLIEFVKLEDLEYEDYDELELNEMIQDDFDEAWYQQNPVDIIEDI